MVERVYNYFEVIILSIGEQIKKARKAKGLTQKQLAEKLNIATNSLSRYEIGERTPDNETIVRIAKVLEVTPTFLLIDVVKESFEILENFNPIRVEPETVLQKIDELNNQYNITPELDYNETNKIIQQKKDTILKLNKLNALGQQKANEYITDLSEQEKYTKPDEE